jgi:hypothetical protein
MGAPWRGKYTRLEARRPYGRRLGAWKAWRLAYNPAS